MFSPTAFGSLYLAFNYEKGQEIPSDFVGSLLNSPSADRFQRLHFYIHPESSRNFNDSLVEKIFKAIEFEEIEGNRNSIKGWSRPWCENLLPFIEFPDEEHPKEIIHSNSEMIFIIDRFPKV